MKLIHGVEYSNNRRLQELAERVKEFERFQTQVEMEIHKFWSPHAGQAPIAFALFRSRLRYVFLQCGRKMGKTDFAIYCMIMYAILFPNSQIYYIADTMKHGAELIWENGRLPNFFLKPKRLRSESNEEFNARKEWGRYLHDKYVLKSTNDDYRMQFKNGSFIKIDGSEQYSNADGIEPDFLVYDEFKHHDPRYHIAAEPNLRVKKAPLLILGTPPEETGTYYEKIANQFKKLSYAKHFKRPSYMNPVLYPLGKNDPEFLEEYNKYLPDDEDVALRELMAEIVVSGSKSLFPSLESPSVDPETDLPVVGEYTRHWRPYNELIAEIQNNPKDWEFHSVFDPGSATCFGVLFGAMNRYTKEVVILDNIYEKVVNRMSTMVIYPESLNIMKSINPMLTEWQQTYDNAAKWFSNEVQYNFEDMSLTPCDKDLKNKENKLGQIKDMLRLGKLILSDKCWWLLWEMIHYRKDEKGKIPKANDHLIDCLRYLLNAMGYDFDEMYKEANPVRDSRGFTQEPSIKYDYRKSEHEEALWMPEEEFEDYD